MKKCDMCGVKIENGQCDCGTWSSPDEINDNSFKLALEDFHKMKTFIISTEAPHLGCAAIYFRGDYNDCETVKDFIKKMKGRPYYDVTT